MLIGSHNSASYTINWNISFWNYKSKWNWLRLLGKYCGFARSWIESMTLCQSMDISQQLSLGTQVLDLRISYHDGVYYTSHTFCADPLEDVLEQIRNSSMKPSFILVKPDFENKHTMVDKEQGLLELLFDKLSEFENTSVYYEPIKIKLDPKYNIIDMKYLNRLWFNTDSYNDFIERLNSTHFDSFTCLDCVLTPQSSKKVSIKNYASALNPAVVRILKLRKNKPYICLFDFISIDIALLQFRRS